MKVLGLLCLLIASLAILWSASEGDAILTIGAQFLILIAEMILFFIPAAFLIQFKSPEAPYIETFIRVVFLIVGNLGLAYQFTPKEGFNYAIPVFAVNCILFLCLTPLMLPEKR